MAKKLSTKEILAKARAEAKQTDAGDAAESAESEGAQSAAAASESPAAAESDASEADAPAAPKPTPKSTQDILAAARAQAKGGTAGSKPSKAEADTSAASKPKPAAASSTPKSTKDILAAARAQAKGGGAGAKAETSQSEAPKGGKPAGKAAAAKGSAVPAGDAPSVKEMLEAVRGKKPAAASAPDKPKPKLPSRPPKAATPAKGAKQKGVGRRNILKSVFNSFVIAWSALGTASVAFGLGVARFMMPNVLVEPPTKFKVGPPSEYPPGQVSTKWKASRGIWVVNSDQYNGNSIIYALLSVCTHLGCTPNWLEGEQKFKCPCHGSGFYISGINFEGPAPRPLERVGIRLADDGMLEVDKSVKFQQELGQWEDPSSFFPVA